MKQPTENIIECDIAIIGAGMGGVAAALAASRSGKNVVLTEETDWLGGQMSNQGVSALDEHQYIETFGGTSTYYEMRQRIRKYYQQRFNVPKQMKDGLPLNPGNGWVSRLCFEPSVGVQVLEEMLKPFVDDGTLQIFRQYRPIHVERRSEKIVSVHLKSEAKSKLIVKAEYFLDATELGDLLSLAEMDYTTGAESKSETGEPHAPSQPNPDDMQSFTYCFAVDFKPGENHTFPKPPHYKKFRESQPYTLNVSSDGKHYRNFKMFTAGYQGTLPFWTYRRIFDGKLLKGTGRGDDIALINWLGNDYYGGNIIDKSREKQEELKTEAKNLSLGFLYWLQTECPRDDGKGKGYPEIRLRPDVMGTSDGLSKYPYIRESRRIVSYRQIVEQDIAAEYQSKARAAIFEDSVGIGWYHIDLHPSPVRQSSLYLPTKPFQIPLGALIPQYVTNLIAANKNIGTTHITNGAYRLHPVEWNIGESAGYLAAYCCDKKRSPSAVYRDPVSLKTFQYHLLQQGIPISWAVDLRQDDPGYNTTQLLLLTEVLKHDNVRGQELVIQPGKPISEELGLEIISQVAHYLGMVDNFNGDSLATALESLGITPDLSDTPTWQELTAQLDPAVEARFQ